MFAGRGALGTHLPRAAGRGSGPRLGRLDAMTSPRTLAAAVGAALSLAALVAAGAQSTAAPINPKHFFWAQGQAAPSPDDLTNDIVYHGGSAGDGAIGVE